MKLKLLLFLILVCGVLVVVGLHFLYFLTGVEDDDSSYLPGMVMVFFKRDVSEERMQQVIDEVVEKVSGRATLRIWGYDANIGAPAHYYDIHAQVGREDETIRFLNKFPEVEDAQRYRKPIDIR